MIINQHDLGCLRQDTIGNFGVDRQHDRNIKALTLFLG